MQNIKFQNKTVRVHKKGSKLGGKCTDCKKFKSYENFTPKIRSNGIYYLNYWCHACRSTHSKKWRKNNLERKLFKGAKGRAKARGREFSIEESDIVVPKLCPVLGIPLIDTTPKLTPNTPSIDRIDNSKGYVKGNIIICSLRANRLKHDATVEELQKIIDFMNK